MIKKLKYLYELIFKRHCPECGDVMDCYGWCEKNDTVVYKCRGCGQTWL